ncbi:hypothetical protein [Parabacteroides sp. Marseille-P3160]|jgi:uncharacterized membrane protein HdeD (DUF308 family)|uniref:hypothetical protein n=1 Tax=Parabacteroides sp. Marseille-P3160 TaxID=1917887 RepID=UPI0009BA7B37|nr:hypothetical protein [Parabacteroides sp. Marseille-P3160]
MIQQEKSKWGLIWGVLMVVIYGGMAYLLIFTAFFEAILPLALRIIFGIVFLLYGIYRAYRIWKGRF